MSAELVSDHYVGSEAYWRHEQDILADVVRIMRARHEDGSYAGLTRMQMDHEAAHFPNVSMAARQHSDTTLERYACT